MPTKYLYKHTKPKTEHKKETKGKTENKNGKVMICMATKKMQEKIINSINNSGDLCGKILFLSEKGPRKILHTNLY